MNSDHPPTAPIRTNAQLIGQRKFWSRTIWVSLIVFVVSASAGIAGTVFSMVGAFNTIEEGGTADADALAGDISFALVSTAFGMAVATLTLLVLLFALIRFFTLPKPEIPDEGYPHSEAHRTEN